MPRQIIQTDTAPLSPLYSQAVLAGGQLFVSGMVGLDPVSGELAGATVTAQTRQALANCSQVLAAGGASSSDIVEVGILLADPADFAELNEEWTRWFGEEPPARYVAKLGVELPGILVSIRMTAFVGPTGSSLPDRM